MKQIKEFEIMTVILSIWLGLILLGFSIGIEGSGKIEPHMVHINGGTFLMGQHDGETDEEPAHEVLISDFLIGKYEVTVSEYRKFCSATKREMPPEPEWGWKSSHPIINTSWEDAYLYIKWLNQVTQENYRLPTEAEFEYVIRNGGEPGIYPWGNGIPEDENLADETYKAITSNSDIWEEYDDGFAYTAPVGSFKSNKLGVHDINGNVWEWCSDWHEDYSSEKLVNPKGPAVGESKVGRGASYDANPWHCRTASRSFVKPSFRRPGFRLAKDYE